MSWIQLSGTKQEEKKQEPKEEKAGIAIVAATFYQELSTNMVTQAIKTAHEKHVEIVKIVRVPGVFDVPLAVKKVLNLPKVVGVVALGAVIQGETAHDKVIGSCTAKTLQELSLEFGKPVSLGITGPGMTREQAIQRINRAKEATLACISVIDTLQHV